MTSETYFTLIQAASACNISPPTLRKYLEQGRLPNAKQTPKGKVLVWSIPMSDLLAAGLMDKVSNAPQRALEGFTDPQHELKLLELTMENKRLEQLLASAEAQITDLRADKQRAIEGGKEYREQLALAQQLAETAAKQVEAATAALQAQLEQSLNQQKTRKRWFSRQ